MGKYDFGGEQPVNPEQKCCCTLVLDVSGSMGGKPIQELNDGLKRFQEDILKDQISRDRLEVAIVTFDSFVKVVQDPKLLDDFTMPVLQVGGSTRLVDGVREGIQLTESRKQWYKSTKQNYYRPYIVLITDGAPDSGQDISGLAQEIQRGVSGKSFNFWAFGVDGADMKLLNTISDPSCPALHIANCDFAGFFQWLSSSMEQVSKSKEGQALDLTPKKATLFQHIV